MLLCFQKVLKCLAGLLEEAEERTQVSNTPHYFHDQWQRQLAQELIATAHMTKGGFFIAKFAWVDANKNACSHGSLRDDLMMKGSTMRKRRRKKKKEGQEVGGSSACDSDVGLSL
jgi:hypothetical protein